MTLRFFIDECLSPEVVTIAVGAGFPESTCSRDRNLLGLPDWRVLTLVVAGDSTLVTQNSRDFRGDGASHPGGPHAAQAVHAGLVCPNSYFSMDLERQRRLFELALKELEAMPDLVNQALEVFAEGDKSVTVQLYEIPAHSG